MKTWTVYKHTCLENNKVYIGITSRKPQIRWGKDGHGYVKEHQPYFYNAIQKYGWDGFKHEILFTELSKEEAESKEIELIAFYKADNRNYGYNRLSGGNCTTNPSKETRRKQAEAHRGRKMSEETKQKLREANLGQKRSEEARRHVSESAKKRKRHPVSQETKDKISRGNKGKIRSEEFIKYLRDNAPNKMPVKQYDLQGNFINEYQSVSEASRIFNVDRSQIFNCCYQNGYVKTCAGYQWKFSSDNREMKPFVPQKAPRPVSQYDFNGNFIREYGSAYEAAKETGFDSSSISKCCKGKLNNVKGYIWKYTQQD